MDNLLDLLCWIWRVLFWRKINILFIVQFYFGKYSLSFNIFLIGLVWFYGISTIVGYLIANLV